MFNKKVIIDSLRNLNKPSKTTNRNSFDFNEPDRTEEGFISAQEGVETPIYKAVRVGPSPIEGKGLFAEQAIKKGDVIGVSHIRQNFTKNGEEYRAPFPSTVLGYYNHSEEPNVYEVDKGDHILMVAGRDIPRGQEITSDYSKHNIEDLEVPEDFKKGGATRRPKMPKGKSPRSYSRSFEATNRLFAENPLFAKPKSRKNKIFDPRAQYYAKGGVTEVDPTFECDDDGRCYETDQIQNMLDRGRDIPREVLNTDWDVINQVYPEKGKGISAAIAWKQRGVPTLESRLGPINPANCMWAAGSGWMCEPEFKNVPKTAFESNDKFINAVNKGTVPFTRVTKTTDPYFDFKSKGLLQPGDIINLKGPNTSHAMTFSHYREDGMPIYVDSNGKATDFDWDEGIWPGIKPGNGRTAYISRFNPEMLFGDKIKELEEKARTNPTYVETELTQEDIDKYVKGGYIVEELSKARNGLEVKEIKPIKDTSVPSWKSKLFNRAVIPMGYDMFTVLSAPLEAITPKALKYKPKEFATKNRLDAFRVYNGLEPEFNTFTTNPDGTLAANHFRLAKEDFKKIIDHPKKSFGTTEIADNFNFAGIHGNGWITKGVDNQGRKFIDFTDTWDLNPLRGKKWLPKQVRDFEVSSVTGSKPYDLKNRIYYDDAGNFFDHNGNKLIEEVQHFPKGVVNKHKAVDLPMLSTSDVVGTNQMDVLKDWNNINNHKFFKGGLGAFGLTMWGLNNLNKYLREEEADKESINDDIEIEIPEEDVQKYVDGGLVKALNGRPVKTIKDLGRATNITTFGTANTLAKTFAPVMIHPARIPMLGGRIENLGAFTGSPLNVLPFYGKKIESTPNAAFRKFGDTLDFVKMSGELSPAHGPLIRMGKNQIMEEGNWAALNQPNEWYPGVMSAKFDFDAPGTNLGFTKIGGRDGVLITDAQGNRMPNIPISDPGLSFQRRLPFSNRYIDVNMEKLRNNQFDISTVGTNTQALLERYGYGMGYAALLGAMGLSAPKQIIDDYINKPLVEGYSKYIKPGFETMQDVLKPKRYRMTEDGSYEEYAQGGEFELGDEVELTNEQVAELEKYGYTLEQV